jgi:crotonobetainyl-CoA hydratase
MNPVKTKRNGQIVEITIDRPKANAIDTTTSQQLGQVFKDFRDDPEARVAILTGGGERFFSAGWDLKAASAGEDYEADYGVGGFGGFPELPGLNKPVIAAVNGMAVGGGFELVLASDLVVSADHAEFFFGELAAGVIPDAGTVRLPRMVPPAIAKELILTGRRLSADEAHQLGLVNRVVPANELLEAARSLAVEICAGAPLAVAAVLEAIRGTSSLTVQEALAAMRNGEFPQYTAMLHSEDAQEGPAAFSEDRPAQWKGR